MKLMTYHTKIFPLTLLFFILLLYGSYIHHDFMIDDFGFTEHERLLKNFLQWSDYFTKTLNQHYEPFYYILNVSLFKAFPSPAGLYAVNLLLFYGVCLLLWFFVLKITQDAFISGLTALIFCVHPINAENLTHITLNNIFLMSIFLLLSLISFNAYALNPQEKSRLYLSVVLFAMALLCQGTAIVFPIYVFLLVILIYRWPFKKVLYIVLPYVAVWAVYIIVWSAGTRTAGLLDRWQALHIQLFTYSSNIFLLIGWYVKNIIDSRELVYMFNLMPWEHHIFLVNLTGLGIVSLIILIFFQSRKYPVECFGLGIFLSGIIIILPASIGHPVMGLVIEPYWLFLSFAGLSLSISSLIRRVPQSNVRVMLAIFLVTFFCLQTVGLKKVFRSELSYAEHWLEHSPGNLIARRILGTLYIYSDAPLPEGFLDEMIVLVSEYQQHKNFERASSLFQKIMKSQRPSLESCLLMADAFNRQGMVDRALEVTRTCTASYPESSQAYFVQGVYLGNLERFDEAIGAWEKARTLDPDNKIYGEYIEEARRLKLPPDPLRI